MKKKHNNNRNKTTLYYNTHDEHKVYIQNKKLNNCISVYKNVYNQYENVIQRLFEIYCSKSDCFHNEKAVWNSLKPIINKFSQGIQSSTIEQEFKSKLNNY